MPTPSLARLLSPRRLLRRLRALVSRRVVERDLEDEIRLHLELEAAQRVREGMAPAEARARALREFGGVERVKEECRDARGVRPVEDLARDLRFAARSFARRPGWTSVVVLTLAVGVGGVTAIYGAVHGILLAPFPYPDAERIVTVWQREPANNVERGEVSPANFLDWRERSRSFAAFAAAEPYSKDYLGPDGPEHVPTWLVSAGFFEVLGTPPLLGRTFTVEEYTPGRDRVVVLGYDVWRRRFGGDPSVLGRTIVLDSVPTTVVGVMPPRFRYPAGRELWSPRVFTEEDRQRRLSAYFLAAGRLRPGVSLAAAQAELDGIAAQLAREHPRTNVDVGVSLVPLPEQTVGHLRRALLVLLGAVACVLLIACANVASLLLARAVARERELAVRVALGAGRARIVRQLAAEGVLLAAVGGAAGILVAAGGIAAIRALAPAELPRLDQVGLDLAVLAFAALAALGSASLFSVAPALHALRADVHEGLRAGVRSGTATRGRRRLQGALIVGEFALALVLLVGAGLLVRSFVSLLRVERGFDPRNVLAVTVQAWGYYPTPERRAQFVREAEARLAALPGVVAAGMTSSLPLAEAIGADHAVVRIEGRPTPDSAQLPSVRAAVVTSGYFRALRVPLVRGRLFTMADDAAAPPVAVISDAMARRFWPGEDPIGKRFSVNAGPRRDTREVVGVVGDVRHEGLHEAPQPTVFVPHPQAPTGANAFVVRTAGPPLTSLRAVQGEFRALNAAMPLASVTTLDALLADSLRERRFHLALLGAFAAAAVLLAAVGIYGVMSHATSERTHEIGIRLALGARPADVVALVVRQGGGLAAVGALLGVLGAVALTRVLRGMLFGVTPHDLPTYAGGAALLLALGLAACWVPARRAARLDPASALREG